MKAGAYGRPAWPRCLAVDLGRWDYGAAWDLQAALVRARLAEALPDLLLLVEHPHVYTVGRGGDGRHILWNEELLQSKGVSVFHVDRGGDVTYHGPGQAVGYPIVSLRERGLDPHRYLRDLEEVLIRTLADYGIRGNRVPGMTGVWVDNAKVAAIGVKFTRAVTSHGFALNVNTDLSYFLGIVPCGLTNRAVTSMQELLGRPLDMEEVHAALSAHFAGVFERRVEWQSPDILAPWMPPPVPAAAAASALASATGADSAQAPAGRPPSGRPPSGPPGRQPDDGRSQAAG